MIAKCKAISHGKAVLEYAMREGKMDRIIAANLVCGMTPAEVFDEFDMVNRFNTRCKNKCLRFEIGIAPQDQAKLKAADLSDIAYRFAAKMGLKNHQWMAVTHKDTKHMHIHLIANRISVDGTVYGTDFVSNRSAKAAEEISRELGLTIAKEIKAQKDYIARGQTRDRISAKQALQKIAYATLVKCKSPQEFIQHLARQGVKVEFTRNKQNRIYGMRFGYGGHIFKASEVGREFGLRTLYNQYGFKAEDQKVFSSVPKYRPTSDPKPAKTILQEVPKAASTVASAVIGTAASAAAEGASLLSGILDITPSNSDYDPDQAEYLRQQRLKKKKKKQGMSPR